MVDLAIVIVNYNTRRLLQECLTSVYQSEGDLLFGVWVVDNASSDGSADTVATQFPQAHLIRSELNGGYPYANNLGLRQCGALAPASEPGAPRFVLLLNPDTLLPPWALAQMMAFMDAHPEAGAAGPRLIRANGELDLACRRGFPTPVNSFYKIFGLSRLFPHSPRFARYNLTYLDPSETAEVDSVAGSFMMVRCEAIQQVGLLDEDFFMYGEDLDWAYRMKASGWKIYYHAQVVVLHYKGEAARFSPKARYEFYRAMYVFYQKHYRTTTPWWLHWLTVGGIALVGGLAMVRQRARTRHPALANPGAQA